MTCDHTPWGQPGGTTCVLPADHDHGHVYHSGSGSDVPDRHDATSGGEH